MAVEWKLVKKSLKEINGLSKNNLGNQLYGVGENFQACDSDAEKKNKCVLDLFYAGYISAFNVSHEGAEQIMSPVLNNLGLNLMKVLGDQDLWRLVEAVVEEDGVILDLESMQDIGFPAIFGE